MFLPRDVSPEEIMTHQNLRSKTRNVKVLMRINKDICGLKEAGALASAKL